MDNQQAANDVGIVNFVFRGLFEMREWGLGPEEWWPDDEAERDAIYIFQNGIRLRLIECNGERNYNKPNNVDGNTLWRYYCDEFLPVVEAIRRSVGKPSSRELRK